MERRRAEESGADYEQIRRDWVLGSEAFRQELLAAAVERVGPTTTARSGRKPVCRKAERMVKEEIGRLGWMRTSCGAPQGHRAKVCWRGDFARKRP